MDLDKIYKKLKPKDVPMLTFPEMEKLIFFFKRIDDDITLAEVSKRLDMSLERLFEINHKVGLHFRENLAPKVLFKAMINASKDSNEEFIQFFQRPDVDICCHFLFKVVDVKKNLRNIGTPQYEFMYDNWVKYRGY